MWATCVAFGLFFPLNISSISVEMDQQADTTGRYLIITDLSVLVNKLTDTHVVNGRFDQ